MRISIWPNASQSFAEMLEVVRHAEATGWHRAYVADHFMGDGGGFGPVEQPTHEATALLAGLAAATERIGLASLVFGITYRHPAVLANWAATVDQMSGGRLLLGVGAGWQENEHEQYGLRLGPPGERVERLDEACSVLAGMLRTSRTTVVGGHYRVIDAVCEPKPAQERLPLLIGGKGDRMLGVVARHADVWNMWGLAPVIAERSTALDRRCEQAGRDPAEIARTAQALVFVVDDEAKGAELVQAVAPRAAIAGPPGRFAEALADWDDAGVDEVIVPDFTLGRGAQRQDRLDALAEVATPFAAS